MTTARPAHRPAATLLALALAATTGLAVLAPATGAAPAGAATAGAAAPGALTVIVTAAAGGVDAAAAAVRAAGGTVLDRLPLIGGVGAELPAGTVLAPAYVVAPNSALRLSGQTDGTGRVSTVRTTLGLPAADGEGAGMTIAVVDTGVADSPDLEGRLTHVDVTGTGTGDDYGHGTFVAGVAAGSGAASDGRYAGVAPGATVLDVRVADAAGGTDLLTVLKGLQVVAQHPGVDVLNLSLSSGSPLPHQIDPLTVALSRLWTRGVVVVVPAGNDGPRRATISSPGTDPTLLTVGSLDESGTPDRGDDVVPEFSARGPAPQGAGKPDLVAPGRSLISLRAPGSTVDRTQPGAVVGEDYFVGSGTSFSTGAVSGAVAVLLADRPDLTPDQVKGLLRQTAYRAPGLDDRLAAGAGGVDLGAARAAEPAPLPVGPGRRGTPGRAADASTTAPPEGDVETWQAFLDALLAGDRRAAANSWSQLSPEAHRWAGHRWAAITPEGHRWAANSWSGHRWAGADGSADAWQMRLWAAEQWAGHRWADGDWSAHRWATSSWAGHRWASDQVQASRWAGSRWAASRWAALWE